MLTLLMVAALPAVAVAAEGKADENANPYGGHTDDELTALAADWDTLDRQQRRALLTEMQLRMARQGKSAGVLHIRTERRYGRIIRQSDGRVIRIETQVVQVRPANAADLEGHQSFGIGFEHRAARRDGPRTMIISAAGNSPLLADQPLTAPLIEPPPMPLPTFQVVEPAP